MEKCKYKMGGTSKVELIVLLFTQKIYKEKFNISLPRTTITQVNVGTEVKNQN